VVTGKTMATTFQSWYLMWLALVSIYQTDVTSFSKMEEVLNGYVTNPNPTPTLTPNPNRNPNSNPNQINKKIQKETTLKTDQMT
jgi:hypothetical protein